MQHISWVWMFQKVLQIRNGLTPFSTSEREAVKTNARWNPVTFSSKQQQAGWSTSSQAREWRKISPPSSATDFTHSVFHRCKLWDWNTFLSRQVFEEYVGIYEPNLFTFSASIFLKSQWHQASKTLTKVVNFVKPALHVTKTCYISLTNIHSFVLQTKHFHWSSLYSCLGNCLVWKVNLREKTFTLHGWTQMVVI